MEYVLTVLAWYCGISFVLAGLSMRTLFPNFPWGMKIAVILTSPLLMPYFAYQATTCVVRAVRQSRVYREHLRTFSDYSYAPMGAKQLDPELQAPFDALTSEFAEQGFEVARDYALRTEPYHLITRSLWNEAGTERASIAFCIDQVTLEISTILSDGTNVITASLDIATLQPTAADRLILVSIDTDSVPELLAVHRQAVNDATATDDRHVLAFDPDQTENCIRYNHRLFYQWKHRLGESTLPPVAELPVARKAPAAALV